jgi:hypothetical protein
MIFSNYLNYIIDINLSPLEAKIEAKIYTQNPRIPFLMIFYEEVEKIFFKNFRKFFEIFFKIFQKPRFSNDRN